LGIPPFTLKTGGGLTALLPLSRLLNKDNTRMSSPVLGVYRRPEVSRYIISSRRGPTRRLRWGLRRQYCSSLHVRSRNVW